MGRRWETQCVTRRGALHSLEGINIETNERRKLRKLDERHERQRKPRH